MITSVSCQQMTTQGLSWGRASTKRNTRARAGCTQRDTIKWFSRLFIVPLFFFFFYLWAVAGFGEMRRFLSVMGTDCVESEPRRFPDALWRCCCYWFHLCKHTHYSVSELKAAFSCPRLIRALERYGASVGFHNEVKDAAASESYPHLSLPLCCLTYSGLLHVTWGLTQTKRIVYHFFFFFCRNDVISISSGICFYLCMCVCVFLYAFVHVLCARRFFSVYNAACVCARGCLMWGWGFTLQWLRDITAIYWATRDWAHWDFYRASQHKCANQMLMQYWAKHLDAGRFS